MSNYKIYQFFLLVLFLEQSVISLRSDFMYSNRDFNKSPNKLINENSKLLNLIIDSNRTFIERSRRSVTSREERKWEHGIIPYEFEPFRFTEYQLSIFKNAMLIWENNTCIKFVERKPEHKNFIVFTEKSCGCCSYVGKKGGVQEISFSVGCTKLGIGVVLHEFGHVIGYWHEHTRPDRDEHVEIIYENVKNDQLHNFGKMDKTEIDSLGSPYDFYSIMHYSNITFSKDEDSETLKPKNEFVDKIGQRIRLSKQDIIQANLLYKCPINGQTLQQPKGLIDFNEYLEINKIEKDQFYYEWRIVAPSVNQHIMIKIEEINFNYFENTDCDQTYLIILDGYESDKSPLIKKFCIGTSSNLPLEIYSKTNRVMVIYKKSKQNILGNLNFKVYYEFKCGGQLTAKNGQIQSPNYPMPYSISNCEWTIEVEANHKIILNFLRFDLHNTFNCLNDYLEIRDGSNEQGRLINKYCSSNIIPNRIQSPSNKLFIRFVSDDSNDYISFPKTGFNITYTTDLDECEQNLHNCDQMCINTLDGFKCDCEIGFELARDGKTCLKSCGGVIKVMSNGVLTSPGYPNEYTNHLTCRWELRSPPDFSLFVNFSDFDLENNSHCVADYFTLTEPRINHGKFCGNDTPRPLITKSNRLFIEFNTDKSVVGRGFSMNYKLDQNECLIDNGDCEQICINKLNDYQCKCRTGYILASDKRTCKRCKYLRGIRYCKETKYDYTSRVKELQMPYN